MGEDRDMFADLGWEKEIKSLRDLHVPFTPSPKYDICAGNQCSDDYELTPFLQSTQAWRWKMQEVQKQYTKNKKRRANVQEKDVTRCMNSESNDAAELNVDIDQHRVGGQGGRQIFEVIVVSREDETLITASSFIEGTYEA
jgi:hypothetical protein